MNNLSRLFGALYFACFLRSGISAGAMEIDTIFLRLYVGSTNDVYIDQNVKNVSFLVPRMESKKPTVLYIHGFTESVESKSVKTVIDGYLKRKDHNILAADYRTISNQSYWKVVRSTGDVGIALAEALNEMVKVGLDTEKLHIVGHSLGAQVAGHIGRKVGFQVPRITGLDPAGPFFNFFEDDLTSADARFVDIIHTDFRMYGIGKITGTVDFFPNGGHRIQPGCPHNATIYSTDDFCSHRRSWRFYAESLTNEKAFLGIFCQYQFQIIVNKCDPKNVIPMGFATPLNAKGNYFLVTNSMTPYGLQEQGAKLY